VYAYFDYVNDKNDSKSILGRISVLDEMIVDWGSKNQHTVSLSSSEGKYIAYGEACHEAVFMCQLMEEITREHCL